MRLQTLIVYIVGILAMAGPLHAQEALPSDVARAFDGTVGNNVLQLHYLTQAPIGGPKNNLGYGVLLTENREFIASSALMFDTDLHILPRLTFQIGPQGYLARLATGQKTDVAAIALGANVRYELIRRMGLAVFGSGFYSPGVLTFGSAHNLYDFTAGAELRFIPRLVGIAGYRWLKFTLVNEPDERVANEVFAGLRWQLE
jgi:hypothetical protein